jgi:N-acetylglucosamine malate deacetylase 1
MTRCRSRIRPSGRTRIRTVSFVAAMLLLAGLAAPPLSPAQDARAMRIIVFGAHPDDCELEAAGTAARWAKLGYKVKFVSVTNGDIGHHELAGAILARRRTAEVKRCAEILGIETEVLDIHDGELLPTLENRRLITRKIREWRADVVISHRPNDYHPDHRYTGILVQDAAFMVIVPSFCPDVPALRKNPVFLYTEDGFKKPNPFEPDVVVPIDPVLDQKAACVDALESQFYEWNPWLFGYLDQVPPGSPTASGRSSSSSSARRRGRPSSMPRHSRSANTAPSPAGTSCSASSLSSANDHLGSGLGDRDQPVSTCHH